VKNGRKIERKKRRNKFRDTQQCQWHRGNNYRIWGFLNASKTAPCLSPCSDMAYLCLYEDAIIRTKSSTTFCTI
jgi:hypothetical protein